MSAPTAFQLVDVRLMVDAVESIVWAFDASSRRAVFVSKQVERILGYSVESLLEGPRKWEEIVHPDDRPRLLARISEDEAVVRGHELEFRVQTRDGRVVWIHDVMSVLVQTGRPCYAISLWTDITERKRLEDERAEVLAKERSAHDQLTELARVREEFLSLASHELVTPLTPLLMNLELLQRLTSDGADRTAIDEVAGRCLIASRRILKLVEHLLNATAASLETMDLGVTRVDVSRFVRDTIVGVCPSAAAPVRFHGDDGAFAMIDVVRLEEVVCILLNNSLKFAAGSDIDVSVVPRDGRVRIVVRDHGPGIPKDERERVFEKFARAASSRNFGGFGLGLHVARRIVEAHGGTLSAEAPPDGTGIQFVVDLPSAGEPSRSSTASTRSERELPPAS